MKSGNDFILSFSTAIPKLYTVQSSPELIQGWTNVQFGIQGDGTLKAVTVTNAIAGEKGFYRLSIETPTRLVLPQAIAFAFLGHSCGGIQEKAYVTGIDPARGLVSGLVDLSTTCSTGGRGSPPATFRASAAVTWDLAGNVVSSTTLSNAATIDPALTATDAFGDTVYNIGGAAYLAVPTPAMPAGVTAAESGDQFQVSWIPNGVNPLAITSSVLTAVPIGSTAPILQATVPGSATSGAISLLQPQTAYQVTVINTTIGGSSLPSTPIIVTTYPATVAPSAPTGVAASWTTLDPTGAIDTIVATWLAADPGNSPIDQYQVAISGSDGAGTLTQTVPGTTRTALFTVDYVPN